MKCAEGHVHEECTCPEEVVIERQLRLTVGGVFFAIGATILLLGLLSALGVAG